MTYLERHQDKIMVGFLCIFTFGTGLTMGSRTVFLSGFTPQDGWESLQNEPSCQGCYLHVPTSVSNDYREMEGGPYIVLWSDNLPPNETFVLQTINAFVILNLREIHYMQWFFMFPKNAQVVELWLYSVGENSWGVHYSNFGMDVTLVEYYSVPVM